MRMEKFLFAVIALLVCSSLKIKANPWDFEIDGIYYHKTSDSTVKVTYKFHASSYSDGPEYISDYSGTINIPSQVSIEDVTYQVTAIGDHAFDDSDVSAVVLPNTIQSIGDYAFTYCVNLTSMTIPSSVVSIGYGAFYNCTNLNSVYISDLSAWLKTNISIQYDFICHLYLNGNKITTLNIPEGTTEIKDNAFSGCKSITSITIPNTVTSIGNRAFSYCIYEA